MPKVKIPRKSTSVDMTAMCDVAFLLLTFFILTTKFRPQEAVTIDIPSSTAQIPIPEKDIMMFQIAPDGRLFFGLDDQNTRLKLLERLSTTYELTLTQDQKDAFRLIETWGMDIRSLPDFLKMDPTARGAFNHLRIAIKGDKTTEYRHFDKLIQALQNRKVNKFNLITSAKTAQE